MKKKKQKSSVAEKIIKIINKRPQTAEEIKKELKDNFGYNEKLDHIRMTLLRLLRREKIRRTKENKIYKYHL